MSTTPERRIAWIACSMDPPDGGGLRWFGHVAVRGSDGERLPSEHGPDWISPEHALGWAREKAASEIYIRLSEEGQYWWAGAGPLPQPPPVEVAGSIAFDQIHDIRRTS